MAKQPKTDFEVGQTVYLIEGAFANWNGEGPFEVQEVSFSKKNCSCKKKTHEKNCPLVLNPAENKTTWITFTGRRGTCTLPAKMFSAQAPIAPIDPITPFLP